MENTSIKNHVNVTNINYELLQKSFEKIDTFVKENDFQFKDRKGLDNITESGFNTAYADLSNKKRKKLAKYLWALHNRPMTLAGANRFLHFLFAKIMKSDLRVRIIKSEKELAIEAKRKAYKDALEKVKVAYADYKTEKGDFYKKKTL
jgi:site-specific DNA-adenine methylase